MTLATVVMGGGLFCISIDAEVGRGGKNEARGNRSLPRAEARICNAGMREGVEACRELKQKGAKKRRKWTKFLKFPRRSGHFENNRACYLSKLNVELRFRCSKTGLIYLRKDHRSRFR